jgi:hypothetical protein
MVSGARVFRRGGFLTQLGGDKLTKRTEKNVSETNEPAAGPPVRSPEKTDLGAETPGRAGVPRARGNMLPGRERRRLVVERMLMRLIATAGIVGIGVALGAILASNKVQGWITGLVVAVVSVVLSAILWSSRQL